MYPTSRRPRDFNPPQALDSKSLTPISRYLTAARQLSYFGYLTLDTIGFLSSTKIWALSPTNQASVNRNSQKLWLSGIFFSIVHSVYKLQALKDRELKVIKTDAEGKLESDAVEKERAALHTQLLQDGCDFVLPATGLGYLNLDEGVCGAAGVVSSYLGLKAAWKKTA